MTDYFSIWTVKAVKTASNPRNRIVSMIQIIVIEITRQICLRMIENDIIIVRVDLNSANDFPGAVFNGFLFVHSDTPPPHRIASAWCQNGGIDSKAR